MSDIITTSAHKGSYTTTIKQANHTLTADEPENLGGNDKGMNPYGLLASALGACTSMTLQMYAGRKEWDLQEIEVKVEHNKDYESDCSNCEKSDAKIDVFKRSIKLKGNLDEKQKEQLLTIANKCPVHKTLAGDIKIETQLV